jgi:hypothetical protein
MTPLLSGGFINTKYIVSGIPQYWYEMANYTNKSLDPLSNRILLLPDQYYFSAYNWEDSFKVIVVNIDDGLIQIPVVRDTCHGCGISYTLQVNSYLFNNLSTGKLEGLMQLFGLTHILQRNDFYLGYYKQTQSPSEIKQILSSYPDILLEKTIGQLDLYSYKQASSSPIIYSPDNVFAIDTLDDLVPSLQMHRLTRKDSFITLDDVKNQYLRNSVYMNYFFGVEPANVSKIEQINNSLYRIHVQTRSSFYLIFQESFHPKWELLVAPDEKRTFLTDLGFGKYEFVNSAAHYVANGYANGWFVDTDELCRAKHLCVQNPDGSYDIDMVIEFWPQRWFYLGLFISGTTLTGCIGYLLFDVWRGRRRSIDSLRSLR